MRIPPVVAGACKFAPILLVAWGASSSAFAGSAPPSQSSFPEEARKRLDYEVGDWESEIHRLDRSGRVVRTTYSRSERRYVIPGRVIEVIDFGQDDAQTSLAWVYYSLQEGKYCLTSIDQNGSLMTLRGDLGPVFTWTAPTTKPDGSTPLMRFTHTEIEDDSFTALGEMSADGGNTWTAFTRQCLTKTGKE
jgi:hypothetical protein